MRELKKIPKHVAFIVDGNRRWARKRGLPAIAGHKFVVEKLINELIAHAQKKSIDYLTFWVFSTENWKRGEKFSKLLFSLLKKSIEDRAESYDKQGIRFRVVGDIKALPKDLRETLLCWQGKTENNPRITVTIAINYGGRDEIVRATKKIIDSQLSVTSLTKEKFSQFLDTQKMPDPDIIVRTGGEKRLSGFLLWQSEYSELYFTDTLMPDFDIKEFDKILQWFSQRKRRFGS